jgi:hypothetical protein
VPQFQIIAWGAPVAQENENQKTDLVSVLAFLDQGLNEVLQEQSLRPLCDLLFRITKEISNGALDFPLGEPLVPQVVAAKSPET